MDGFRTDRGRLYDGLWTAKERIHHCIRPRMRRGPAEQSRAEQSRAGLRLRPPILAALAAWSAGRPEALGEFIQSLRTPLRKPRRPVLNPGEAGPRGRAVPRAKRFLRVRRQHFHREAVSDCAPLAPRLAQSYRRNGPGVGSGAGQGRFTKAAFQPSVTDKDCCPAEGSLPCRQATLCLEPDRTWFT